MISFKIGALNPRTPPTLVSTNSSHLWAYFLTENAKIARVNLINEGTIMSAPIVDQIWNFKHNVTALVILRSFLPHNTDLIIYFGNVNGQVYKAKLEPEGEIQILKEVISFNQPVKLLRLSSNQEYLVCVSEGINERVRVVKLETGQRHFLHPAFDHSIEDVQIDQLDGRMAVALANGSLYIYDFPPAYRNVQEEEELEAEDQELLELLREEEDEVPSPNQARAILKIKESGQQQTHFTISWGQTGLYVGGCTTLVKVVKDQHYHLKQIPEVASTKGVFEKVQFYEGKVITQNGQKLSIWKEENYSQIFDFQGKQISAWNACSGLFVGIGGGSEVQVIDLSRNQENQQKNPFMCSMIDSEKSKNKEEQKEDNSRRDEEEFPKEEEPKPRKSFNNSADIMRKDMLETEEILCSKKEGVLIRTMTIETDVIELQFRDEARKSLNTKIVNEHACQLGCFSVKGIMLVKNGEAEYVLIFRKLREASLFVSNWEAQMLNRVECLAMSQKYNMCATENGEVHLFSLNGLKLGSINMYYLVLTIAASENSLVVLYYSETEEQTEQQDKEEEELQERVFLKVYDYDSFGEFTPQTSALALPASYNCSVKWVGFMEKMEIIDEEENGEVQDKEDSELPLVLFQNGELIVFSRTGVWLEIKRFESRFERVVSVELDSIRSYDLRFPFQENQQSFSDSFEQEAGVGVGGLLMLKNCMGLLTNDLSQAQIKKSSTLSLLNIEYEKKVMKGLKLAISEKNMGLALDYAHLMLTKEGFNLAARTAQKLRQEELAERIETLAIEKKERRALRTHQLSAQNPLKGLLEDHEGLDLNNIRLKYGTRVENSLLEGSRQFGEIDADGETKKMELDSEMGGVGVVGVDQGYSGSSFSFQLSKDTEEILQMQKTEETKKDHTLASDQQLPQAGKKVEKNVGQNQGKLFGKARQGGLQGQKTSFMDALKANSMIPKKRAKRV